MKRHLPILAILFAATAARIYYAGLFELSLDEPYYWLWSLYPQLSYYDHPPMVAYFIYAAGLLGDSERFIRLPAILCMTGVTAFSYAIASGVANSMRVGIWAALLTLAIPMFSVGGLITTPDSPLLLFWSAALYCGYRAIDTQKPRWFYATGLCYGLAMLSKYTAVFFGPAFLIFLMASPENRHWLFRWTPYLAFILGMAVFSPVVYWNYTHDWASFKFQFSHGMDPVVDNLRMAAEFWGGQVALYGLFLFFFIVAASVGIGKLGLRGRRDDYLYLSLMSAPVLLFFVINSLRARMEGNWSAMAYVAAVIAAPIFYARMRERGAGWKKDWLFRGFAASVAVSALLIIYAHIQIVDPILPMPQKREISRRIYGWKVLGEESARLLKPMGSGAFMLTGRYQISSLLGYYAPGRPEAYMMAGEGRFGYLGSVDHLKGKNVLYVEETGRVDLNAIKGYFRKVEPAGVLRIERHGELIREFSFYRCYNYKGGLVKI
ncbi:MAG: glycosyltransferase family 39 protein [Nitrospinae bacterium]|nr:glycosyltransferase family 39 protein [Nitrospinota bacterium]